MMSSTTETAPRFSKKLQNKTVLIIGGSSGVGLSTAAALLEQGAVVIISSSNQSRLSQSLELLRKGASSTQDTTAIAGFQCDLASPQVEDNLIQLRDHVRNHITNVVKSDRLDHLIYTAGDRLPTLPVEDITLEKFNKAIQVRGPSALLAVKTFLPLMQRSNLSSITLTSGSIYNKPIPGGWSILGFVGAGLTGLTRQLASDLAPIRVNCVAPGVVDTDLWSHMDDKTKKAFFESMEKSLPTGRVPTADDVAESYIYLLRDRNVTGSTIDTNGGGFL